MDGIRYWIEAEGSGHWFFVAFPVVLFCLLIWFKGRRVRFLIPSLLISIVIINPLFYKYWDELGLYAYWRILWVVPVVPIVAGLVPSLTERIQKGWIKSIVVAAGVGLIIFGGTFLYNGSGGSFVEAANAAKEPEYVVQIADRLLELDEHPRVIAQDPIGVYLRQYTGEIETLYGRDIYGFILHPSSFVINTNAALNSGNMDFVSQTMVDEGFDYLVISGEPGENFQFVDKVGEYGIYRSLSKPTVIKERNGLGQVVSVTTVDENGGPINGNAGYAKVSYSYDGNGNIIREIYSDIDGEPTADNYGCSGYEREYDQYGHKIMERCIDSAGSAVVNGLGYAEYRREYKDNNLISESYYGVDEKPINCINGYHRIEREYDGNHNIALQRFLDVDGNLVVTGSGYAEVHRVYAGKNLIREEYYGSDSKPYVQTAGYAAIVQEWDEDTLRSRAYLNSDGQINNRTDGYAKAVWEQRENCSEVHFYDVNDLEVEIGSRNLARDVMVNADGWSDWFIPKYNSVNSTQIIGYTNLGPKIEGDVYTSTIEIEFKNVTATDEQAFHFLTQGAQDGRWFTGNVWNNNLVNLSDAPKDGVYRYTATVAVSGAMVDISTFDIGFRCDYWASGMYRVRYVKVEKGDTSTEWSPGL